MIKLDIILTDKLVFPEGGYPEPKEYRERKTVKAVVENGLEEIAFVTNPIHGFYLLPGGGAESGDLIEEIKRECDEEINWEIGEVKEVAIIEEYRNRKGLYSETCCFSAKTIKELPEDTRTEEERDTQLEVRWLNKKEALAKLLSQVETLKNGEVKFYNTGFDILRDYLFLQKYLED